MTIDKPIKILHFIYGLHVGGAETFIYNIVSRLDDSLYHFDFALQDINITNQGLLNVINKNNSKVFFLSKFTKNPISQLISLVNILKEIEYDIVHIHANAALNPVPFIVANIVSKSTKFIIHSHNSNNNKGNYCGKVLHYLISRTLIRKFHIKIACSELAGKWMFGRNSFNLIDNAVDPLHYTYNKISRNDKRAEFNIPESAIVLGSVGRFVQAKNHEFILKLFNQFSQNHTDAFLLLVGDGELKKNIDSLADKLGIADKVVFTGARQDIPEILSAMDCFLLPSLHEGLPFAAIEAQASGLNIVASTNVSRIVDVKNHVNFIDFSEDINIWITAIEEAVKKTINSNRTVSPVLNTRFDINSLIKQIENLYQK